ncbi:hypothetical protein FRC11_008408, partial [Ceratobasidium sp. 423]
QVAASSPGRVTSPGTIPGPPSAQFNSGNLYPPEAIYIESGSTLHEITVDRLPESEKDGAPGRDQPPGSDSPAWGTHFWSIATAAYDLLHVPLPFPFSFDFWDRNDPNASTEATNPRENLPGPTTAPTPPRAGTSSAPLAQPPQAYQPARSAPAMQPPLARDLGVGARPDNRNQGRQSEPPCPPPAQPERRLGVFESILRFFNVIGFGWCKSGYVIFTVLSPRLNGLALHFQPYGYLWCSWMLLRYKFGLLYVVRPN